MKEENPENPEPTETDIFTKHLGLQDLCIGIQRNPKGEHLVLKEFLPGCGEGQSRALLQNGAAGLRARPRDSRCSSPGSSHGSPGVSPANSMQR